MSNDRRYDEVAHCNISRTRQLVLSTNEEDSLVLARRTVVHDEDEGVKMFFEKGATIIKPEHQEGFKKFLENILKTL